MFKSCIERLENISEKNYLNNFIIPVIADWTGQVNIKRVIILKIKKVINSGIPEQVLNLIPIISPLHISLNNIYAVFFRSGFFKGYLKSIVKIWVLFQKLKRHNDNKLFETLNSRIKFRITNYTKSKIIDAKRNNNSFENSFVNLRNPVKSQIKELKSLEKKFSLFLFSIFDKIYQNIGNTKQINNNKYPKFCLPNFDIEVDIKVLPLGWNTQKIPADNKFCDVDNCLLSNNMDLSNGIVLICGYRFH
ncbi:hypothetical protein RhiirA5_429065 [Rhizophagus irregularis]|uniref:Uncharacterized protein n=1 Tax=Rhizophagus irregularis TaxID=588596 RepID=A0A2N0R374_9GLOM|nr:hypothetical protein RhiirA5_429065 [Rhizophagus irregularis]PKC57756.1 hypothetical protein RhiirA1_472015 [Rhizophagus irregularis]